MKQTIICIALTVISVVGYSGTEVEISTQPDRVQELVEAINADPSDRSSMVELGNQFYDIEDWTNAQKWYLSALDLDSEDPNVLTDLATTQRKLGEPLLSLQSLERALKVKPNHWQALFNECVVLIHDLDRKQEALEVLAVLETMKAERPDIPDLSSLWAAAQPPTTEPTVRVSTPLENAAREFIKHQIPEDYLEELYQQASQAAAVAVENQIQPVIGRAITESERSRLVIFWYKKVRDLMPYSVLEETVYPIVAKHLTLEDLNSINAFLSTQAGRQLSSVQAAIMREGTAAGEQLGQKMGDGEWGQRVGLELREQFPQWFQDGE